MTVFLYVIWFLIPLFFFVVALWATLERMGGKEAKGGTADAWRQGFFVSGCVALAVLIDQTILADLVASYSPEILPLGFYQALLLPFILYMAALAFGGSKEILIGKAPKPSRAKKRR